MGFTNNFTVKKEIIDSFINLDRGENNLYFVYVICCTKKNIELISRFLL